MSNVAIIGNASGTGVFTVASPNSNVDRVLTLPDETGTVVSTGSVAVVTETMLATAVVPLGVDQTWQSLGGSRALSTTYTNSTGRPIFIQIKLGNASGGDVAILVDSVIVAQMSYGAIAIYPMIYSAIPAGSTYSVTNNASGFGLWFELR